MLPLVAGLAMSSLNKHGESNNAEIGGLLGGLSGASNAVQPRNGGLVGLLRSLFKKNDLQQPAKAVWNLCWISTAMAILLMTLWIWLKNYSKTLLVFRPRCINHQQLV
ncbi:MAG: hypothetical protein ACI9WC_001940 [Arenicella sp.]|jgi:hypothetical protein